jgi:tetratricopeptide (TPR) repeat protein
LPGVSPAAPTVGLALIVRDEEESLPGLLESIAGAFDRVVLVDTGSTDRTVEIFTDWAASEPATMSWQVGHFEWCDDFSAARRYADSLLEGCSFYVWADADDILMGAQHLREIAANTPDVIAAHVGSYTYAVDGFGNTICTLKRERMVRAGHGTWWGRVHEAQLLDGPTMEIDPAQVCWVHRKSLDAAPSQPRNLRILRKWLKDEPHNPRVLGYLGTEEAAMGNHKRALGYYRRYLKLKTGWDEERAQIHRKLAMSHLALGDPQAARNIALEALKVLPLWPDSYLSLAQAHYSLGEHEKAAQWAQRVLELGQPSSLLILNPTDYTLAPRLVIAGAYGALGRLDDAIAFAEEALGIVPHLPDLQYALDGWRQTAKREYTAKTVIGFAQMLCAHDEQLPALTLLEQCVPHFAKDHPEVVAARSQLRERVYPLLDPAGTAEHYEFVTEDGVPDHTVMARLPRARMLAEGIAEQIAERAAA